MKGDLAERRIQTRRSTDELLFENRLSGRFDVVAMRGGQYSLEVTDMGLNGREQLGRYVDEPFNIVVKVSAFG
jgi:hypothetical protein